MKKTIPLILVCLGLVACKGKPTEMKSDWKQVVDDRKNVIQIDKNSIRGKKEKSFWARLEDKEEKDAHALAYSVIDCENNLYKQTQIVIYEKNVLKKSQKDEKAEYEHIVPQTNMVAMRNYVCNIGN